MLKATLALQAMVTPLEAAVTTMAITPLAVVRPHLLLKLLSEQPAVRRANPDRNPEREE